MAKYNCVIRSSYFYVVDEFEYEKFKQHIVVYFERKKNYVEQEG